MRPPAPWPGPELFSHIILAPTTLPPPSPSPAAPFTTSCLFAATNMSAGRPARSHSAASNVLSTSFKMEVRKPLGGRFFAFESASTSSSSRVRLSRRSRASACFGNLRTISPLLRRRRAPAARPPPAVPRVRRDCRSFFGLPLPPVRNCFGRLQQSGVRFRLPYEIIPAILVRCR